MNEKLLPNEISIATTKPLRMLLLIAGTLSLVLGIIGIVVPILPTTPFLLLAATCYSRASQRFYTALLNNRLCGQMIRQWREQRGVTVKTKLIAITMLIGSLGSTIIFFTATNPLRICLVLLGLVVITIILRLPTLVRTSAESVTRLN